MKGTRGYVIVHKLNMRKKAKVVKKMKRSFVLER